MSQLRKQKGKFHNFLDIASILRDVLSGSRYNVFLNTKAITITVFYISFFYQVQYIFAARFSASLSRRTAWGILLLDLHTGVKVMAVKLHQFYSSTLTLASGEWIKYKASVLWQVTDPPQVYAGPWCAVLVKHECLSLHCQKLGTNVSVL